MKVSVDVLSEFYRERLGLLPWDVHIADLRSRLAKIDPEMAAKAGERRTGRTTRGILKALALCSIEGAPRLVVCGCGPRSARYLLQCIRLDAAEMARKLALPITVVIRRQVRTDAGVSFVEYIDHAFREEGPWHGVTISPPDPMDEVIDGLTLRQILVCRELADQEGLLSNLTPAQRAAVSAHWSAQLRAKVEASRKADGEREASVRYCEED